ncbi:MAG: hypothetical protein LBG58_14835 [Planctomycetaceae bacterium]|nr:hypothetical protein [Planctomycetaceae bacterium]
MFRRNIASAIADLPLCVDGNGETGSTVAVFRRKVAYLLIIGLMIIIESLLNR